MRWRLSLAWAGHSEHWPHVIIDGRGNSIDIACAGGGQAKQARCERTGSCKGQSGRPPSRRRRQRRMLPARGLVRHGTGTATSEQMGKGGCFTAPPAANQAASALHQPPTSMPRTVKWAQVAASGSAVFFLGRACFAAHENMLLMRDCHSCKITLGHR